MNDTNRLTSVNNTNKVEYAYNKPIASSDLNEVQSIITSKIASLNGLPETGFRLKWQKVTWHSIRITELYINDPSNKFQISIPTLNVDVDHINPDPSTFYHHLHVYYRLREVDSNSILYKNGIRSPKIPTICTVHPADGDPDVQITNNIFDPNLPEEVSTRVIVELTFVLSAYGGNPKPENTEDGQWTEIIITDQVGNIQKFLVDLTDQEVGYFGYMDSICPKLIDYCVNSNTNLLPTNVIKYDQYALVLNSKSLLKKSANSRVWNKIIPLPALFNIGSFVRIDKFLDGTSIYDENCLDRAGYIIFDSLTSTRIVLDSGGDSDGNAIIYPEYIITKNPDGTESVELVNHPISAPTFFSIDEVSSAMYDDPDGDYLLCTTINNEIYFRNIFEKV